MGKPRPPPPPNSPKDLFAGVPAAQRERLVERLKLLVEYQRGGAWDKLYDLLSPIVTQDETKEQFLRNTVSSPTLVDFSPEFVSIKTGAPSDVMIEGCAIQTEKGRRRKMRAAVDAFFENGEWYFSPVMIVMSAIDGQPQSCIKQKPAPKRRLAQNIILPRRL